MACGVVKWWWSGQLGGQLGDGAACGVASGEVRWVLVKLAEWSV